MFTYPCGATYSVTLVIAHAQCILVNHKVKGCLYMSHEKSSDPCGTWYSAPTECACVVVNFNENTNAILKL